MKLDLRKGLMFYSDFGQYVRLFYGVYVAIGKKVQIIVHRDYDSYFKIIGIYLYWSQYVVCASL